MPKGLNPDSLATSPFQVVKVRVQAKENAGRFRGSFDCCLHTLRSEGIRGLFTGLTTTVWRNSVWNCVYFWSLFEIRQGLAQSSPDTSDAHATWLLLKVIIFLFVYFYLIHFPFDFLPQNIDVHGTWPVIKKKTDDGRGVYCRAHCHVIQRPI